MELARLHSAVGFAEGEARIAQLLATFAPLKRFSRAEVVHALTTVFKPQGKKLEGMAAVPQQLTPESVRESMIGWRVTNRRGDSGTLAGFKVNGVLYGDCGGGVIQACP